MMMKFWRWFWGPPCEHEWQELAHKALESKDGKVKAEVWLYRCTKCGKSNRYILW